MIGADLDRNARKAARRRQLETDCRTYGATQHQIDMLDLEDLFELRWQLLRDIMRAPRR